MIKSKIFLYLLFESSRSSLILIKEKKNVWYIYSVYIYICISDVNVNVFTDVIYKKVEEMSHKIIIIGFELLILIVKAI